MTSFDLFAEGCNWILGGAQEGLGLVISTWRWKEFSEKEQYELLKTAAIHEGGHTFGLTNRNDHRLTGIYKGHCVHDECVMRQGVTVDEFVQYTIDRLEHGCSLCPACRKELHGFFR